MIPVEQYAARTARLAKIADELSSPDKTWLELSSQFTRLADEVAEKHHAGVAAGELIAQLALLDATLVTKEQMVTGRMTVARAAVTEVGVADSAPFAAHRVEDGDVRAVQQIGCTSARICPPTGAGVRNSGECVGRAVIDEMPRRVDLLPGEVDLVVQHLTAVLDDLFATASDRPVRRS